VLSITGLYKYSVPIVNTTASAKFRNKSLKNTQTTKTRRKL